MRSEETPVLALASAFAFAVTFAFLLVIPQGPASALAVARSSSNLNPSHLLPVQSRRRPCLAFCSSSRRDLLLHSPLLVLPQTSIPRTSYLYRTALAFAFLVVIPQGSASALAIALAPEIGPASAPGTHDFHSAQALPPHPHTTIFTKNNPKPPCQAPKPQNPRPH